MPYTLLTKHFARQTSEEEAEVIIQWRQQSLENEQLFVELSHEWGDVHPEPASIVMMDTEKVWNNILKQINKSVKPVVYTRRFLYGAVAMAASIALLFGLSISLFMQPDKAEKNAAQESVYIVPAGQKSQLILPDGSEVWMNSGSSLSYSTDFNQTQRLVRLDGEAFFDVTHDDAHTFIVETGHVNVLVHGTAFGVSDYKADSSVSVSLVRGSVSVEALSDSKVLARLQPGQKAEVVKSSGICTVAPFDTESDNVWMLNKLQFKGEPVHDVFKKIERWYGVKVALSNENPTYCYWLTLKTESLTETLNLINKITPIDYKINGEEVTIRYK